MQYMGSKLRISKYILPIMLEEAYRNNITTWVEPFVGGGNLIDKVPNTFKRIGIDYNPHTIKSLIGIRDFLNDLPKSVDEEYYKSLKGTVPNHITSLIRFGTSFGSKFESGFARGKKINGEYRNYWEESLRNYKKQSPLLQGIEFICDTYENFIFKNSLIYCDPPYQGTTSYKTGTFNHDNFWQWCRNMSEFNILFISEYNAPNDFECIWEGNIKTTFSSTRTKATHNAVEKLFKMK